MLWLTLSHGSDYSEVQMSIWHLVVVGQWGATTITVSDTFLASRFNFAGNQRIASSRSSDCRHLQFATGVSNGSILVLNIFWRQTTYLFDDDDETNSLRATGRYKTIDGAYVSLTTTCVRLTTDDVTLWRRDVIPTVTTTQIVSGPWRQPAVTDIATTLDLFFDRRLVRYDCLRVFVIDLETTDWRETMGARVFIGFPTTDLLKWSDVASSSSTICIKNEKENLNHHTEDRRPSWSIACMWWWTVSYVRLARLWWQLPNIKWYSSL